METRNLNPLTFIVVSEDIRNIIHGFLVERRSRNLSKRTIQFYQDELRYFTEYLDSQRIQSIIEITPDIIRSYLLALSNHRNSGGCHAAYRAIKAMLNWFDYEYEPESWKNPIKKVRAPEAKVQPLPGISISDIQKMLDACTTDQAQRDKVILLTLLDTGVRASELIGLDFGDIDIHTGSIIIRHGKGDKRRIVYIGKRTLKEMRRYLKQFLTLRNNTPLFITDEFERLTFSGLRQIIRRRALNARVEEPGLHDFRRAFALSMLRNGCDLITLSRLLGHSSVVVTQRYIAQVDDDLLSAHQEHGPVDILIRG